MSAVWYRRKVSLLEWAALVVSYFGIVLVFLHDLEFGGKDVLLGSAMVLGAAVSYAVYLIQSGQMVRQLGSLRLVSYAMCVSSVACIGQFFALRPASMLLQPAPVYFLSVINAIFCTVLPVFMTMIAVQRIGAATASQAGMIGPVSTLFWALFLAEPITGWQIAGTVLVMGGMYLLTRKNVGANMVKAIRMRSVGGPEVMEYVDVELGKPGRAKCLSGIRHVASTISMFIFVPVYILKLFPQA
jgi:drug/metabolite transporter (DMT)-like permease